jgi:hypothetical protein
VTDPADTKSEVSRTARLRLRVLRACDGVRARIERMRALLARYGLRTIAVGVFISLGMLFGCGGNAGVDDGTIVGRVFSDASTVSSNRAPIAGVTVVIRRTAGIPAIVRRTLSDANGNFVFTGVPTGQYTIGYAKEGFLPVDPLQGASATRTNLVGRDIFVESGQTVRATDTTLETNLQTGSGTLILTVLDGVSGDPVTNATITVGAVTTSAGGNNGVYTLSVPMQPNDQSTAEPPQISGPKLVTIQADGFLNETIINIGIIANETVRRTVFMNPLQVTLDGVVRISRFQNLFSLAAVEIRVTNTLGPPVVNAAPNGLFNIPGIPASNSQITRTFNLRFTHPDLQTVILTNIVAPRAGDRTIPLTVVMTPLTVDVVGSVVDSGNIPPNGQAVLVQTGQAAAVVNGNYTIPGVPTRNAGGTTFTIQIRVFNINGGAEQGSVTATPVSDGSPNPIFFVPLVKTAAL